MTEENGTSGAQGQDEKTNVIGEIVLPATMESLPEFVEFVGAVERAEGYSEERIDEIEIALKAALTEIIGNASASAEDVTITCKYDPWGKLMIIISDKAKPFNILLSDIVFFGEQDPVDARRRDSAKLIKRMIDNIEQKRVDEQNILTFTVAPGLRRKK